MTVRTLTQKLLSKYISEIPSVSLWVKGLCCVQGYCSLNITFPALACSLKKLSPLWTIRARFERFGRVQRCWAGGEVGQNKMLLHTDSHSANKQVVCHVKNIALLMGSPIYTPNSLRATGRVSEQVLGRTWPVPWYFYQDFHFRYTKRWWQEHCSVGPNPL